MLEDAKTRLTDAFKALAGDALNNNNEAFLRLANETMGKVLAEAKGRPWPAAGSDRRTGQAPGGVPAAIR